LCTRAPPFSPSYLSPQPPPPLSLGMNELFSVLPDHQSFSRKLESCYRRLMGQKREIDDLLSALPEPFPLLCLPFLFSDVFLPSEGARFCALSISFISFFPGVRRRFQAREPCPPPLFPFPKIFQHRDAANSSTAPLPFFCFSFGATEEMDSTTWIKRFQSPPSLFRIFRIHGSLITSVCFPFFSCVDAPLRERYLASEITNLLFFLPFISSPSS